jgi:hypothetical protein
MNFARERVKNLTTAEPGWKKILSVDFTDFRRLKQFEFNLRKSA